MRVLEVLLGNLSVFVNCGILSVGVVESIVVAESLLPPGVVVFSVSGT